MELLCHCRFSSMTFDRVHTDNSEAILLSKRGVEKSLLRICNIDRKVTNNVHWNFEDFEMGYCRLPSNNSEDEDIYLDCPSANQSVSQFLSDHCSELLRIDGNLNLTADPSATERLEDDCRLEEASRG